MLDQTQLVILALFILFLYLAATGRLRQLIRVIAPNFGQGTTNIPQLGGPNAKTGNIPPGAV